MESAPIILAEDRSISVPPNHIVKTGYVRVFDCELACRARMAVGDVNTAYQRRLQLGSNQPWPGPRGHWDNGKFIIVDGRHDWTASVMLGQEYILVAWVEEAT